MKEFISGYISQPTCEWVSWCTATPNKVQISRTNLSESETVVLPPTIDLKPCKDGNNAVAVNQLLIDQEFGEDAYRVTDYDGAVTVIVFK